MRINLEFDNENEQRAYFSALYGAAQPAAAAPAKTTSKKQNAAEAVAPPVETPVVNIPVATAQETSPPVTSSAIPHTVADVRKALKELSIELDNMGKGAEIDAHIAKYTNTGKLKGVPDDKVTELYEALTILKG